MFVRARVCVCQRVYFAWQMECVCLHKDKYTLGQSEMKVKSNNKQAKAQALFEWQRQYKELECAFSKENWFMAYIPCFSYAIQNIFT